MVCTAPSFFAISRFMAIGSMTVMFVPPECSASCVMIMPMVPPPEMATDWPGLMPMRSMPCRQTEIGSISAPFFRLHVSASLCTDCSRTTI